MSQPVRPPEGRYGPARQPLGRRRRTLLVVAALAGGVALAAWFAVSATDQPVHWQDVSSVVHPDGTVSLTFDVRMAPGRAAVCTVHALSRSGSEVGRRDVPVGPSTTDVTRVEAVVRTSEPAVSAQVKACAPGPG